MLSIESYTEDQLQKRLKKELKLLEKVKRGVARLAKDTNFGKLIVLEYKKKFFKGVSNSDIKIEIHLEGKYPFQPPKVLINSLTPFPSLADGRNLLESIIKKPWSEEITVLDISNMFPQFFNENYNNVHSGVFQLGQCMNLKYWDNRENMKSFRAQEIDPQNPKFSKDRMLVITHSALVQFETSSQTAEVGHLVAYFSLLNLSAVKVSRSDPEKATFEWKLPENKNELAQQFKVKNIGELLEMLLKNNSLLGVAAERKLTKNDALISEEEVNAQALNKIKINEIVNGIIEYEVAIQDDLSKEKINKLIELYLSAIEYFSALNNPKYDIYLQKVRKLNSDENVLAVLNGRALPKKEVKRDRVKEEEFEKYEVWPTGPPEGFEFVKDEKEDGEKDKDNDSGNEEEADEGKKRKNSEEKDGDRNEGEVEEEKEVKQDFDEKVEGDVEYSEKEKNQEEN